MSSRSCKFRFDYAIYTKTGRKVPKLDGREKMENEIEGSEISSELKIREDLKHALEIYKISELESEEEIKEGLNIISDVAKAYRHVHVDLKSNLVDDYEAKYPKHEEYAAKSTAFIKEAHKKIKILKRRASEAQDEVLKEVKYNERISNLEIQKEVLDLKISNLEKTVDLESALSVSELDDFILKMEAFINEYFELSGKFKYCPGTHFEHVVSHDFSSKTIRMSEDVKMAKMLRRRLSTDVSDKSEKRDDKTLMGENLSKEITLRSESLELKLDQDLTHLSDYQILEVSQNKKLDTEFNYILEKITDLAALVCEGGDTLRAHLDSATRKRDELNVKRKAFFEKMQKIVLDRDVTPDKLKNAATMRIDLPKFSGYDCKMDLFTFKSEFQKLVEPTVQKPYLADYLKHNYLSGSALSLVEKERDYQKIWDQLFESFGNTRLLLQNKLGELDNLGLWNVRGDEKIANALSVLLNAMKDLSSLATEHDIEGQLYEGGGLEKVMSLIGDQRHRKYRTQNLDPIVSKKDEWEKLLQFLKHEQHVREKVALDNKTAKLMGFGPKNEKQRDGKQTKSRNLMSANPAGVEGAKCHFCDQDDHAVVTTRKGNKIIPYYVCEAFVDMSPAERFAKLQSKNLCTTCLFPGAVVGPKHKCLYVNFCCPNSHKSGKIHVLLCEAHKKNKQNLEILDKFKEKFISNAPQSLPTHSKRISCFSEIVGVSRGGASRSYSDFDSAPDISESAIFQLQTIEVAGMKMNVFFDNGCGGMIIKKSAAEKLKLIGRANQEAPGPLSITGVGDKKTISDDGIYSVCLSLHDGKNVTLSGVCLEKITAEFPRYDLSTVENDLIKSCKKSLGPKRAKRLPKLPSNVGGETEILLGSKYLRYFPKMFFQCESGLGIYKSVFSSPGGSRGVVGGPHPEFSKVEEKFHTQYAYFQGSTSIFSEAARAVREYWKLIDDVPLLGMKPDPSLNETGFSRCCTILDDPLRISSEDIRKSHSNVEEISDDAVDDEAAVDSVSDLEGCCDNTSNVEPDDPNELSELWHVSPSETVSLGRKPPKCVKQFDEYEKAGTEVSYRCVDCRECLKCKQGARLDSVSIQEEVEQSLCDRSVDVMVDKGESIARLPFVTEPDSKLDPHEIEAVALKVFRGQTKLLSTRPEDRQAVIESERKLQDLGFVDYVDNLMSEEKTVIFENLRYFIPWRAVYNENSKSTPCRLVFDASQATKGGCSLNSLLAKGANSLNKLVEILVRWTTHGHAFHTDVSKMYNRVWLDKQHWRYQLYFWSDELAVDEKPRWKVMKTLTYGVRSSGNLAQCALRKTADICKAELPRAFEVIHYDTYVDDCISGTEGSEQSCLVMDELQLALSKGGFSIKGFVESGKNPPKSLCSEDGFVLIGGLKWFPKGDFIKLNAKELNFNKKIRGKKSNLNLGIIPQMLTKRDCVSKYSETFDPLGKIAPILAGMKLDVSLLHQRCLNWDDPIPNELKNIWANNFDLMGEIANLSFARAVIPADAVNTDMETLDVADAGENMICAAIYARFKRRNGTYSCQLIFARTKIVHNLSIPRAELEAALLNASTGHLVQLSLKNRHKGSLKLTDSQVVLHWLNCTRAALKMYVRNRVLEIVRLTGRENWRYIKSADNIADLGTRKGAKLADVGPDSNWLFGYLWMRGLIKNFPVLTVDEVILSNKEKAEANREKVMPDLESAKCMISRYVPHEVGDRYKFSKYLIDPIRFRFRTVVRILGLVFIFIMKISKNQRKNKPFDFLRVREFKSQHPGEYIVRSINLATVNKVVVVHVSAAILNAARSYFFEKATLEIKRFVDSRKYDKISVMKDGIMYYTGRILPVQEITGNLGLADVCFDLAAASFCVPITDAHSPIAYAIAVETHWYDPDVSHGGIESLLRYSQQTAHIIGGRDLVKSIKKECAKCRILLKKGIQAAMGPVGGNNLQIAPPFYTCQVDICGPFNAYSPVNKRATVKIWFTVFCCTVTGATDCRVMENYTADAFVMSFVRFSCRFSYPKLVLPDEGSQLVKGCEDMVISMSDIQHKLSVEYGVTFKTCPVGAHYVHGKVERKIQDIKKCLRKSVSGSRLSVLQWETLGQQVANSINNVPIGLGNKTDMLENLDILSPNRLLLGRNNSRSPTAPLEIKHDVRKIIQTNNEIFQTWFKDWLISYVPTLIEKPKWFKTERNITVGDVVLFLKSEQEFDRQYQYGIVTKTVEGRDGIVRMVEVEYQNPNEKTKRYTKRGVRDLVVIHPVDEIGISKELFELANSD